MSSSSLPLRKSVRQPTRRKAGARRRRLFLEPLEKREVLTAVVLANPDAYNAYEDSWFYADSANAPSVLANDSAGSSTATLVSGPLHGSLTLNSDGTFYYLPANDFTGVDSFTYEASDGVNQPGIGEVTINVLPVNDAPAVGTGGESGLWLDEDSVYSQEAPGLLAYATDIDGDILTASTESGSNLTVNSDGSFVYTPAPNFHGVASFVFTISDGQASAWGIVAFHVIPTNDPPVGMDQNYEGYEDTPLATGSLLDGMSDADGGTETFTAMLYAGASHGTVEVNGSGTFIYTPQENFSGTDTFTYQIADSQSASPIQTVTINVLPVNDAPTAFDDSFTLDEDTELLGDLVNNDTDIENTPLSAVVGAGVSHGTLTIFGDGTFSYVPEANFSGSDSFTYYATDGSSCSNTVSVSLMINEVNDAPTASDDIFSMDEDTVLNVSANGVLGNDTDVEPGGLLVALLNAAASGEIVLNSDGSFTYTPDQNFSGEDSFTYLTSDGSGLNSNSATVFITVSPVAHTFTVSGATIDEGDSAPLIAAHVIQLNQAAATTLTFNYWTVSDTATAGQDFEFVSGQVTFYPGDVTKTVEVAIVDDDMDEDLEETYQLYVEEETDAGNHAFGDGTITDDDVSSTTNEAPYFEQNEYTVEIAGGSAAGAFMGAILATDPENDALSYEIDGNVPFYINSSSGAITTLTALDPNISTYQFNIKATDTAGNPATTTVFVAVGSNRSPVIATSPPEVVDTLPEAFRGPEVIVAEVYTTAAIGTVITIATAVDPDGDPITWSLSSTSGALAINSATGAITLTAHAPLQSGCYLGMVKASDGHSIPHNVRLVVKIVKPHVTIAKGDPEAWNNLEHATERSRTHGAGATAQKANNKPTFVVSRSGPMNGPLAVRLEFTGTARSGEDFRAPATVVIPHGQASKEFTVSITDDSSTEGSENFVIRVSAGSAATSSFEEYIDTVILDNDLFTAFPWPETFRVPAGESPQPSMSNFQSTSWVPTPTNFTLAEGLVIGDEAYWTPGQWSATSRPAPTRVDYTGVPDSHVAYFRIKSVSLFTQFERTGYTPETTEFGSVARVVRNDTDSQEEESYTYSQKKTYVNTVSTTTSAEISREIGTGVQGGLNTKLGAKVGRSVTYTESTGTEFQGTTTKTHIVPAHTIGALYNIYQGVRITVDYVYHDDVNGGSNAGYETYWQENAVWEFYAPESYNSTTSYQHITADPGNPVTVF